MAKARKKTRRAKPEMNGQVEEVAEHDILMQRAQMLRTELEEVIHRLREIRLETSSSIDASVDTMNRIMSGNPPSPGAQVMAKNRY